MKLKLYINVNQALELVRSGASDIELMRALAIDSRALEKLFIKLEQVGALTKNEIEFRSQLNRLSDYVDLVEAGPVKLNKTRIKASRAVTDIRKGLSDIELMQKYNISLKGLRSLFSKLIDTGEITREELDHRNYSAQRAELVFRNQPFESSTKNETSHGELNCIQNEKTWRPKIILAVVSGICIGVITSALVIHFVPKFWSKFSLTGDNNVIRESVSQTETDKHITILESIGSKSDTPTKSSDASQNEILSRCFQKCERDHGQEDKSLLANCKRECLNDHSDRFQQIRRLYHNSN